MTTKTTKIIGALLLVLLASGVVYISLNDTARIRVDEDKSTFYIKMLDDNGEPTGRWLVSGREYNRLFDGSTLQYRDKSTINVETIVNNISDTVTIKRYTGYQNGASIIDTYFFDGKVEDVELFPISHKIEIFNATGLYYRYTVDELKETGEKRKLIDETLLSFGYRMKVELEPDYRWAWIGWPYGEDSLSAQYDIDSNYEVFNVRLFDPEGDYGITNGTATQIQQSTGRIILGEKLNNTNFLIISPSYPEHSSYYPSSMIVTIDPDTLEITSSSASAFDLVTMNNGAAMTRINDTAFLVTYSGADFDGYATILSVDGTTVTNTTPYEFETIRGDHQSAVKINDTHYLVTYIYGHSIVLVVDPTDLSITNGTSFRFDATTVGTYNSVVQIDDTHYLNAYSGADFDGFAIVLNVSGTTISANTKFEFDTGKGYYNSLFKLNDTHYLNLYGDTLANASAVVLIVDPADWTITAGTKTIWATSLISPVRLVSLGDNYYATIYLDFNSDMTINVIKYNSTDLTIEVIDELVLESNVGNGAMGVLFERDEPGNYITIYDSAGPNLDSRTITVDVPVTDTCTCAGLDTNWDINMSDNCNITDACDLGTGILTISGDDGTLTISEAITASEIHREPDDFDGGYIIELLSGGQLIASP